MIDIITQIAIAVGSVIATIATKALDKTSDKVAETLSDKVANTLGEKTDKFITALRKQSPDTATAIEKANEQPLDYEKVILAVEAAAKTDPQLAQIIAELVTTVQAEPLDNLSDILKDIANALKSQPSQRRIDIETIEKIVNFAQGDINIHEQNITI